MAGARRWFLLQGEKKRSSAQAEVALLQKGNSHEQAGQLHVQGRRGKHGDGCEGCRPLPDSPACGGCGCAAGDSSSLSDESLLPLSEVGLFKVLPAAFSGTPVFAWLRLGTGPGCSVNLLTKKKHRQRKTVSVKALLRDLSAVSAPARFCLTLTAVTNTHSILRSAATGSGFSHCL